MGGVRRRRVHLIPNHDREQEMLATLGLQSVSQLFDDVPKELQISGLNLPDPEPERALVRRLRRTLGKNRTYENSSIFMGGGLKPQLVPSSVVAVCHRQELINAYTPYQPEVSQGLLQCLFEFQSVMADLVKMEVVNSSMYDGATALGEAVLMAARVHPKRTKVLLPKALHADKQSICENYANGPGIQLEAITYDDESGEMSLSALEALLSDDVAMVVVENPNFFGIFESKLAEIGEKVKAAGALFCVSVDPTCLGVCTPPGLLGADIVVGEASGFGGAPALGGPLLGLFATTKKLVRKMPGRLIGATLDESGNRGYVMTLQAREQHIRRAKATSNICSNEAIMAVQAMMHLILLGRKGLREMGLQNLAAGQQLLTTLREAGHEPRFSGAIYNEVLARSPTRPGAVHEACLNNDVHAGLQMIRQNMELEDCILWGSSPVHASSDYFQLAAALSEVHG